MSVSLKIAIVIVTFTAIVVGLLVCPPWYWANEDGRFMGSRGMMAGHGWIWGAPPAPSDLPGCHPVVWWARLALEMLMAFVLASFLLLGVAIHQWCTERFQRSRPVGDSVGGPSNYTIHTDDASRRS